MVWHILINITKKMLGARMIAHTFNCPLRINSLLSAVFKKILF